MAPIIIEISPDEGAAMPCLRNGESLVGSDYESAMLDCCKSGDAQPACEFVRDEIGVEFRIVAKNDAGVYENRIATHGEMIETCRTIYFESETDFARDGWAATYLIWEAAQQVQNEKEADTNGNVTSEREG